MPEISKSMQRINSLVDNLQNPNLQAQATSPVADAIGLGSSLVPSLLGTTTGPSDETVDFVSNLALNSSVPTGAAGLAGQLAGERDAANALREQNDSLQSAIGQFQQRRDAQEQQRVQGEQFSQQQQTQAVEQQNKLDAAEQKRQDGLTADELSQENLLRQEKITAAADLARETRLGKDQAQKIKESNVRIAGMRSQEAQLRKQGKTAEAERVQVQYTQLEEKGLRSLSVNLQQGEARRAASEFLKTQGVAEPTEAQVKAVKFTPEEEAQHELAALETAFNERAEAEQLDFLDQRKRNPSFIGRAYYTNERFTSLRSEANANIKAKVDASLVRAKTAKQVRDAAAPYKAVKAATAAPAAGKTDAKSRRELAKQRREEAAAAGGA